MYRFIKNHTYLILLFFSSHLLVAQVAISDKVELQLSTFSINYDETDKRLPCFPGLEYQLISDKGIVYNSGILPENTFPKGSFYYNNHPVNAAIILPVGTYSLVYKAQYKTSTYPIFAGIYSIINGDPYSYLGTDLIKNNPNYLAYKFITNLDPNFNSETFNLKNYFESQPLRINNSDLINESDQIIKKIKFNVRKKGDISLENYKVHIQGLVNNSQGSKERFNYFLPVYTTNKNNNELDNYTIKVSEINDPNNYVVFKVFPNKGGDLSYFQKIEQNGDLSVEEKDVYISKNEYLQK
jgi:hypothetical protein